MREGVIPASFNSSCPFGLVRTLTDSFGDEVLTFYNIFAPATYFKMLYEKTGNRDKVLADLTMQNKDAVKHALNTIAEDLSTLARRVITEGKADGIYLSVQNVQDSRITPELYNEVIAPSELIVLETANRHSENNILHICGYEGSRNDLNLYVHYNAKVINWAVNVEGISLAEGKKLFGGRAVIGGFDTASIIGLTIRAEDADKITDMESFAKYSGKLVPIAPQNAQWAIVEEYNRTHPDNQVNLVASEVFNISDAYTWVLEGRYDAYFDIKLSFYNNVLAENAPYRDFADKLAYVPYRAIPTYPLFNKNDQALADAYDEAVEQLRKDGVISELSQKYFGEDIFKYIDK